MTDVVTTKTDLLLEGIRAGREMTRWQQLELLVRLSLPAMVAQIATIVMNYIDASWWAILARTPVQASDSLATSVWLFAGLCNAVSMGFSVQVAHLIGANDEEGARNVLRQALIATFVFSVVEGLLGILVSPHFARMARWWRCHSGR